MRVANGKICTRCKEFKQLVSFSPQSNGYLKRKAECKSCMVIRDQERRAKFPDLYKTASKARYQKHRDKILSRRKRYYWENRVQERRKYKVYYEKNKVAIMNRRRSPHFKRLLMVRSLKWTYGLTLEQYMEMKGKYGGVCPICGMAPKRGLMIDHNHKTDKVRGLLCDHCNRGLGYFRDNIAAMEKAIMYLKAEGAI